jgi:rhombotail lipoprotein
MKPVMSLGHWKKVACGAFFGTAASLPPRASFIAQGVAMTTRNVLLIAVAGFCLSGCALFGHLRCAPGCSSETRNSSSLVEFLYPGGALPPPQNQIPQLRVPLRVGLAFLPEQRTQHASLAAANKQELLERIRARFQDRKFVSEIVVIPDYYLKDARGIAGIENVGGFAGLQGVQRLYNIDLMALVSYDQVTHLDDNEWSLGYLTIVGAYVLKGSRHDTVTLVDLAVVDPVTRSLVLRAGGTDVRQGNATLIEQQREARSAGLESFGAATAGMIENFDAALTAFEADVRSGKANVRVARRDAGSRPQGGGGAMDWLALAALLPLLALKLAARRVISFT